MQNNPNDHIKHMILECNRIVVTKITSFNSKHKKGNKILADIRDTVLIDSARKGVFMVNTSSFNRYWMSPVEIYINFRCDKLLIGNIGILLGEVFKNEDWTSDFEVLDQHWLRDQGIDKFLNT